MSQGCEQEVIRDDQRDTQKEKFQRVAQLTNLIFTNHGLKSAPKPSSRTQESDSDQGDKDQEPESEDPSDEDEPAEVKPEPIRIKIGA